MAYDIQLIKSRINCVDIAKRCGLPITKSGDRCVSPLRPGASNPSSFAVDDDFYYDFGNGQGGDVIDLLAELKHSGDRGAAIRELAALTGVASDGVDNSTEWLSYTHQLNARTAFYHAQLTDSDRDYLRSRGLTDGDIDRLMIGRVTDGPLRGRLFLPYFSGRDGYVCYYATRSMPGGTHPDAKYMKQKRDEHCRHIPWGLQTLDRDGDTLVIAEGYFDAVSFECGGYPVISAITGHFSRDQIPTVLSVCRKFKRVFIVYDDDSKTSNAGERFTERMADLLTRNRIPFVVGTVPMPYHDISEYYAAGGDLSRIIDAAQDGIQYIAGTYSDFDELSKFVYSVARYVKRTKLEDLFSVLRSSRRWDADALKSLYKSATSAPPETVVADEIMEKHQLIHVPAIGFYEYQNGYWNRIYDGVVGGYADRAYGEFSTANRVTAIVKLLKTRALRAISFNQAPVWNFVNGTLELDTGVFREHNPGDYCSFQLPYPYNPEATYHRWEAFMDDITAGDAKKSELLQFIPAYVLMPHCRFEKIFCLTGSGGNGKSVYLAIMRKLFGDANISNVKPHGLIKDFQRIALKDSILNIAGEIKSSLEGVEEVMKEISSGEPISACYKGEQYVTFVSRAKLLFALNGQLSSGDTSDALTRRLIIVDFPVSFVDNPDPSNPYQRQKNIDIMDELIAELNSGGIFNWAYEGYKLLSAVRYFTETNDQTRLINDFKQASNPVLVFWDDQYGDSEPYELLYAQAYADYLVWCGNNGHRPLSSLKFHFEMKGLLRLKYEAGVRSVRIDGKPRKQRYYRRLQNG